MNGWMDIGQDAFSAAGELHEGRRGRSALSRAYFAAYARSVAALIQAGVTMPARGNPEHQKVPPMIQLHLGQISEGRRANLASALDRLYKLRIFTDYWPSGRVTEHDSRMALGMMAQVFRETREVV